MTRYEITVDGRAFDVQVLGDPTQDRVEVEVDGEVLAVEVRRAVDTTATPAAAPARPKAAPPPAARPVAAPVTAPTSPAGNSIRAPLPGVIKRVLVQSGQEVAPGDLLLVLEAMKMDNAIRATRGGVIEAVHAIEGRQVAHGDELLRYKS